MSIPSGEIHESEMIAIRDIRFQLLHSGANSVPGQFVGSGRLKPYRLRTKKKSPSLWWNRCDQHGVSGAFQHQFSNLERHLIVINAE